MQEQIGQIRRDNAGAARLREGTQADRAARRCLIGKQLISARR